ncbi:ABC-type transport auxiliary lipoprotein family protein [Ramlibacter sp.]|uniref:ABC-type transport auxiliary lipoprotein family protein n=1 Tax=Ramlibacter sp. TaxID=1917967 RepID=UPI002FC7FB46
MIRRILCLGLLSVLAACGALPDKPARQVVYDFGPPPVGSVVPTPSRPALLLAAPEVNVTLESTAVLYRLAYDDAYQLRPYALARWSAPPGQLVSQRLRTVLSRDRAVLDETASAALAQRSRSVPLVLRVRLEEFNHRFDSASDSKGVLRLRCTLLENTPAGERFVAQRSFDIEQPAPSADAAGGVRALTAATDAVARDIAAWLEQR